MTETQILRTGVLFKKGSGSGPFGRKNWKPRYFVLTPSRLQYFTFEDGERKGELSLQGCDEGVLEVMPADSMKTGSSASTIWRVAINAPERRLLVAAGTEMEMNDWVDKLVLAFRINSGQPSLQRASMPAPCSNTSSQATTSHPTIRDFQNFAVSRRGNTQRHSTGADMRPSLAHQEIMQAQIEMMQKQKNEEQEALEQQNEERQVALRHEQQFHEEEQQQADYAAMQASAAQKEEDKSAARKKEEAAFAAAEELQRQEKQAQLERDLQKQKEMELQQAREEEEAALAAAAEELQRQEKQEKLAQLKLKLQKQKEMELQQAREEEEAALAAAEELQRQEKQEKLAQLKLKLQKQKELELQQAREEEAARIQYEQEQEMIRNKQLADEFAMQQTLKAQPGEDMLELQRRQKREKHLRQRADRKKAVMLKLQQENEEENLAFRMSQPKKSHVRVNDELDNSDIDNEPERLSMPGGHGGKLDREDVAHVSAFQAPTSAFRSSLVGDVKREMIQKQQIEHQRRREAALTHHHHQQKPQDVELRPQARQQVELEQQCNRMETLHMREMEVAPREIEVVRRAPVKKPAPARVPMESYEF